MTKISIDAAALVTSTSTRTLRRRLSDGTIAKLPPDELGRTMLPLTYVQSSLIIPMTDEDLEYLAAADSGDADAQDDVGQLFLQEGKAKVGVYWLNLAAQKDHPNAMQRLGQCYAQGEGVPKDENLALMWIAKAAAFGHKIAAGQMAGLRKAKP